MPDDTLTPAEAELVGRLVRKFADDRQVFAIFAEQLRVLVEHQSLRRLYHSLRWRVKDPDHLRDKLERQILRARASHAPFDVTEDNLFSRVNDLVGLRLLHLHTTEFIGINEVLMGLLEEQRYVILEGPTARVWDEEYTDIFTRMGVATIKNKRLYTSVHYVIEANTRTKRTAEIQVRTLAEELWGEVDHTLNYPHDSPKLTCREQIKVLARVTSSATRLVDSIFAAHNEPPPQT